ncbi:putative addiction module killer domain protein [Burkholderia pseudomallei MSHR5492]|nr:putative addiction module killer domain protein [Burkholderia pseudomallei MSHR5492]
MHQNARLTRTGKRPETRATRAGGPAGQVHENHPVKRSPQARRGPRRSRRSGPPARAGQTLKYLPCDRVTASWGRSRRSAGPQPPRQRQAAVGPLFTPTKSPYPIRSLPAIAIGTMGRQTGQRDASRDTNGTATGCPMRRRAERLRSSRSSDAKRAAPGCPVRGPSRGECASLHWLVRLEPLLHSCSRIVPYGLQFSHVQSSDDPPSLTNGSTGFAIRSVARQSTCASSGRSLAISASGAQSATASTK